MALTLKHIRDHLVQVLPSFTSIISKPFYLVTLFLHLILKSIPNKAEGITLLKCKSNGANLLKFIIAYSALTPKHHYAMVLCVNFLFCTSCSMMNPATLISSVLSEETRNICYSFYWEMPSPAMRASLWLLPCAHCAHFQQVQHLPFRTLFIWSVIAPWNTAQYTKSPR